VLNIALWLVGWDKYALSQIAYAEVSFAVCFVINKFSNSEFHHHTADSESQLHAGKGEFLLQMDLFARRNKNPSQLSDSILLESWRYLF